MASQKFTELSKNTQLLEKMDNRFSLLPLHIEKRASKDGEKTYYCLIIIFLLGLFLWTFRRAFIVFP